MGCDGSFTVSLFNQKKETRRKGVMQRLTKHSKPMCAILPSVSGKVRYYLLIIHLEA